MMPACLRARLGLFVAQGVHGIDAGGPLRGDIAGEKCARNEDGGGSGESNGIVRLQTKEERFQKGRGFENEEWVERHADGGEQRHVAENEPNHSAAQGGQRHADSDLGSAARDGALHGGVPELTGSPDTARSSAFERQVMAHFFIELALEAIAMCKPKQTPPRVFMRVG